MRGFNIYFIGVFMPGFWCACRKFAVGVNGVCVEMVPVLVRNLVQYFPSWDTLYMKYDVTHILTSLKNDVKGTERTSRDTKNEKYNINISHNKATGLRNSVNNLNVNYM
jgi:hypothetical protein